METILLAGIFGAVCLSIGYWIGAGHARRHYRLCAQLMKAVDEKERVIESIERDVYAAIETQGPEFDPLRKDRT